MDVPPWVKSMSLHDSISVLPIYLIKLMLDLYHKHEINLLDGTGRTPLQIAISKRLEPIIKLLIDNGAKLDTKDVDGNTALHYAVLGDDRTSLRILEMLIEKSVDINIAGQFHQTPLHVAVKRDFEPCIRLLLGKGASVNVQDSEGKTPLHYAVLNRKDTIVKLILEQESQSDLKDKNGQTALHLAAHTKYVTGVSLLLDSGSNVNAKDDSGNTPLHYSVSWSKRQRSHYTPFVDLLMNKNANLVQNNEGQTPLHCAVISNCFTEVTLLLHAGGEVNVKDVYDRTPLHYASMRKRIKTKIFQALLDHGAQVNSRDIYDRSPLHWAAKGCFVSRGVMLMEFRADINAKDLGLNTPLHLCLCKPSCFGKLLLEKGCEVDVKNRIGYTPLQIAVKNNLESISKLLIDKGAEINVKYFTGGSLLHAAVSNMNVKITEQLLQNGVDIDFRDEEGQTALHYAAKHATLLNGPRCKMIVNLILLSGANVLTRDNRGRTPDELALNKSYIVNRTIGYDILQLLMEWSCLRKDFISRLIIYHPSKFFCRPKTKCLTTSEIVKKIIVKMNCAGLLPIGKFNSNMPKSFHLQCRAEFEKLKTTKFDCHKFSDVFLKYTNLTFLSNVKIVEKIFSSSLDNEFPLYATILRSKYIKARERLALIPLVGKTLKLPLPDEILWEILSYVNDEDLDNVVKAAEINM